MKQNLNNKKDDILNIKNNNFKAIENLSMSDELTNNVSSEGKIKNQTEKRKEQIFESLNQDIKNQDKY